MMIVTKCNDIDVINDITNDNDRGGDGDNSTYYISKFKKNHFSFSFNSSFYRGARNSPHTLGPVSLRFPSKQCQCLSG